MLSLQTQQLGARPLAGGHGHAPSLGADGWGMESPPPPRRPLPLRASPGRPVPAALPQERAPRGSSGPRAASGEAAAPQGHRELFPCRGCFYGFVRGFQQRYWTALRLRQARGILGPPSRSSSRPPRSPQPPPALPFAVLNVSPFRSPSHPPSSHLGTPCAPRLGLGALLPSFWGSCHSERTRGDSRARFCSKRV